MPVIPFNVSYKDGLKYINNKCSKYTSEVINYDYKTIYFIPDIHGDFDSFFNILKKINCIIVKNNCIEWNPKSKNICIIQSGDIISGYREQTPEALKNIFSYDLLIIKMMLILSEQAKQYNSNIILLYGNHEILALIKILKYSEYENFYHFTVKNFKFNTSGKINYSKELYLLKDYIICNYKSVVLINDILVCHCGLIDYLIKKMLDYIKFPFDEFNKLDNNDKIDILNNCGTIIINYLTENIINNSNNKLSGIQYKQFYDFMNFYYTKIYKKAEKKENKKEIVELINNLGKIIKFNNMIIGHNMTNNKKIVTLSANKKKLYLADNGLSRVFNFVSTNNPGNEILKYTKSKNIQIVKFDNIHNNITELMNTNKLKIICNLDNKLIQIKIIK